MVWEISASAAVENGEPVEVEIFVIEADGNTPQHSRFRSAEGTWTRAFASANLIVVATSKPCGVPVRLTYRNTAEGGSDGATESPVCLFYLREEGFGLNTGLPFPA